MTWPLDRPLLGFSSGGKDRLRTYVWQEEDGGFYEGEVLSKPGVVSSLPNDVRDTGLHRGDWHLLISPSMEDRAVFVTNGLTTQVWARAESPPGCP